MADGLREAQRNALLRRVDWRFLLRQRGRPRLLDLTTGALSEAVRLIADPGESPTLAVLPRPSRQALRSAAAALEPAGEIYCEARLGHPAWLRRQLLAAGFVDVRIYWCWPPPERNAPQFWLPADSPDALRRFLRLRPARTRRDATMRVLWWPAARLGLLAPLRALARRPPGGSDDADDMPWLLLTGGRRSVNKVVAVPVGTSPEVVVKIARVPEAEPGLEREEQALRALAARRPQVSGAPRIVAADRRAGAFALVETAIHGRPLIDSLNEATFERHAGSVTRWLIDLASPPGDGPRSEWLAHALDDFERDFRPATSDQVIRHVRAALEGLGDLPQAFEHRDCAPWNVVLAADGTPALLDWESAQPDGLPYLDLVYFLANAAFVIERAFESGETRATYRRLLDATTALGATAVACMDEYCAATGVPAADRARLRLLCWVVHCRSEHRRLAMDVAGPPKTGALRASVFLGLIEEELRLHG